MKISIGIPTCKPQDYLEEEIHFNDILFLKNCKNFELNSYVSCSKNSAAYNRNLCLRKAEEEKADIVIQCDDDITSFYPFWWENLIEPLIMDSSIGIVSARLIGTKGQVIHMSGDTGDLISPYFDTKDRHLCTACFAMWRNNLRFDENFIGSGFEDTDFGLRFIKEVPNKRIVINNKCKLLHLNEMKNQKGKYWEHNKEYFLKKHPEVKDTWHG